MADISIPKYLKPWSVCHFNYIYTDVRNEISAFWNLNWLKQGIDFFTTVVGNSGADESIVIGIFILRILRKLSANLVLKSLLF